MLNEEKMYNEDEIDEVESDLNVDINKFSQAVIWGTDWTAETINSQMIKKNIDLSPSFQRRDAWDSKEKSRLIESLMLGLPVPPIILAENKIKRNSYIVIDGKQRLLSIRQFYASKNSDNTGEFEILKLSGLEILKEFNGYGYIDSNKNDKYNQLINSLDNQPIRTIVIKNWPDESFLYTVFLRLNTGSKKLSSQELRQALKPGPFLDYLDKKTAESKSMQHMLHNTGPDKRMKDIELALRYYAFRYRIENYAGNLKEFLDDACDEFNKKWDSYNQEYEDDFSSLEKSIDFAFKYIDKDNPFSRQDKQRPRFNRSLFELFTYYFTDDGLRNIIKQNKEKFKYELSQLYHNDDFNRATSFSTKNIQSVTTRFELFAKMLKKLNPSYEISCFHLTNDKRISVFKL